MRLVLSRCKSSRSLQQLARILKVCIEALIGLSHIYHPDDLDYTFLTAVSLNQLWRWGQCAECTFQGQGWGEKPLMAGVQLVEQRPLNDLFQHVGIVNILILQMKNLKHREVK